MSYRGYDKRDRIQNLWVMSLPNAHAGIGGRVDRSASATTRSKGKGLPWMMLPGTPGAHIMIPINPPVKKSTITDEAADEITQADAAAARGPAGRRERLQVRPEDRRAHLAAPGHQLRRVHAARRRRLHLVLQQGHGAAPRLLAPSCARRERPTRKSPNAVAAATKAGTLKPTPFGTMSYRLYGKKDRIQLLWVLSVPGATPESIGVSDGSQRDEAIGGDGRPWLMLPGTPGAHIMIPINK